MSGDLEGNPNGPIQAFKGPLTNGLGIQPMGVGTATLAGAAGSVDGMTVGGDELMSASVAFNVNLTDTATDVASNINANWRAHTFFATSSAAVVSVFQRTAGALTAAEATLVTTLTTMTSTDVNIAGATDTITTIHSGESAVVLAAKYWQLKIDWDNFGTGTVGGKTAPDNLDADTLRLVELRLTSDQEIAFFAGGISADAGAAPVGDTLAADTKHTIPFLVSRGETPPHMVTKVGSNATWKYQFMYI